MTRVLPALLVAAAAAAGAEPEPELLREEAFNYRVVGALPGGWKRRGESTVFAYAVDEIPHAYVHFVRERLAGPVDVEEQVKKRAGHYRFPGAPKEAKALVRRTDWGGRTAVLFEHEATIQGVVCRRRVTALCHKSIWYELIETLHGKETPDDEGCRSGLRVFRRGFRILTPELSEAERAGTGAGTVEDRDMGFRLARPAGLRRLDVDTGKDPGCRVALQAEADDPRQQLFVRFFEYGTRKGLDTAQWMDVFFTSFAGLHQGPRREAAETFAIPGAARVVAERFTGRRDEHAVATLVVLIHGENSRVYALRVRTLNGAETTFAKEIATVLAGVRIGD